MKEEGHFTSEIVEDGNCSVESVHPRNDLMIVRLSIPEHETFISICDFIFSG